MQAEGINSLVIYTGVFIGSLMLLSVIWVWVSKQTFQLGGTLMSIFGTVLIGLSVFSSVTVKIGDDLLVQFNALQEEVDTLREDNATLVAEVSTIATTTELQRQQFIELGDSLRRQNPQLAQPMQGIIGTLETADRPNFEVLQDLSQRRVPAARQNQ